MLNHQRITDTVAQQASDLVELYLEEEAPLREGELNVLLRCALYHKRQQLVSNVFVQKVIAICEAYR